MDRSVFEPITGLQGGQTRSARVIRSIYTCDGATERSTDQLSVWCFPALLLGFFVGLSLHQQPLVTSSPEASLPTTPRRRQDRRRLR